MNETKYYHTALESALMNGKSLKERIDTRIACLPRRRETHVRLPKRLIIAMVAAALLLISSVAVAAALLRNQAFKQDTNASLNETIETVTQPLNVEKREGWQPGQLILFDNVQGIRENVVYEFSGGTLQLAELQYGYSQGLNAMFWINTKKGTTHTLDHLSVTVNEKEPRESYHIDAIDQYYNGHYQVMTEFAMSSSPLWPGTTMRFDGKIDGEDFTLTYTFTEETYEKLRQSTVNSVQEHEALVNAIPDEGSAVGYHIRHRTLAEVAVANNCMYFTIVNDPGDWTDKSMLPYSDYDNGLWPVIDGRMSEFFYLGVVDAQNENGAVYSTYLPYTPDMLPQESLISFFGVVFRYEWSTGKVTVPQSEAEYETWRKESRDLSEPYYEDDWIWHFEAKGENFTVTDLIFHNRSLSGEIGIALRSDRPFDPGEVIDTAESAPVVTINVIPLKHYGEIDPYENIYGGVSSDRHRKGYFMIGCATADLPETFTLSVTWRGETVEISLNRSDVRLEKEGEKAESYYREIFNY